MKDTNHLEPVTLAIVEGPQISVWTNWKGTELLLFLMKKDTHLCLANLHHNEIL